MVHKTTERALLILLLVGYAVVSVLYAIRTPDWQAPDEPAHYNYVAQVKANGCCPVIETGDWDSAYLDTIKGANFAPETLDRFDSIQYEDHQPPLYYLLASVVFALTDGSLLALRLFSVLIGAGVVLVAYAAARALLPGQPQVALGAAALVAFIPQHAAMLAVVNNDGLAELIVALTLWRLIVYVKGGEVKVWALGVLVGIGLLAKINTIFLVGLVPLAIVAKWWIERGRTHRRRFPLRALIVFALPVLVIGGAWWARNIGVYGFPDLFGLGAHNRVVVGQTRTADYLADLGAGEYLRRAVETTFESFWGKFGWMESSLPAWAYWAILALIGASLVGWIIALARRQPPDQPRDGQRAAWALLAITALLAVLQYLYYNTEFVQFQGRYMFPGLIPLAVFVAVGLDGWRRVIRFGWFAPALIALVLVLINLYALWRVVPGL